MDPLLTERGLEVKVPPLLRGMSSRDYFQRLEEHLHDMNGNIYFDCSDATLIDSTALGKIIFLAKQLQRRNQKVVFESCPVTIRDFLTKLKVNNFIDIA